MTVKLSRSLTRETSVRDRTTRKPIMIRLEVGGSVIRLWPKGHRTVYVVPLERVLHLGAQIKSEEICAAKRARRAARNKTPDR